MPVGSHRSACQMLQGPSPLPPHAVCQPQPTEPNSLGQPLLPWGCLALTRLLGLLHWVLWLRVEMVA